MPPDEVQPAAPAPAPPAPPPVASREELIEMVARAHRDSAYGESSLAGRTLAAQSKLPKLIAENLGAGFGQWDFFPEASEIVDFAFAYVSPSTEEDMWTMARTWASDDAAGRQTLMTLVGREILLYELRRVDVPKLRELFEEARPARALALRATLGLEVPAVKEPKAKAAAAPKPMSAAKAAKRSIPARMPKPVFVRPTKAGPEPAARRFSHPKFGEGVLEREEGEGAEAKVTIKFESGSKTMLARFVTELAAPATDSVT